MEASSEIELHTGTEYQLVLGSSGSTGYVWEFEVVGPPGVISVRPRLVESSPPDVHVLQTYSVEHTYVIDALGPGTAEARFVFRRPWEKEVPPLQVRSVRVSVIK